MPKVLVVFESLATPSTTVRALQFRECFDADSEFEATFFGRTSERMNRVMERWPWRPSVRRPAQWWERRVTQQREDEIVEMARASDIVMMMTVPSWSLHQRLAELKQTRLVTDLIDALWLPGFQEQGWTHIHEMLSTSHAVICENEFTAAYTRAHNRSVFVVPDAPQVEAFDPVRSQVNRDPSVCTIGWVGGKYTADALYRVFEPLEAIFEKHAQIKLRLVGVDPDRLPRFENVRWSHQGAYDQQAMVREVLAMDVGIFPMFDVAESLYRGALKSRIYMAGGVAVVGQRLGENETLIESEINGVLAGNDQEWFDALDRLICEEKFRKQIASAGLSTINKEYTREKSYRRLREVLVAALD
jgi:glycosyltransferase involved in cell wall biosynthesis